MNITHSSIAKFQQLVELKDFKPATKKAYVRYVRRLAEQLRRRIVQGQGGKDRYVPLTLRVVEELRAFWKTHRNPV